MARLNTLLFLVIVALTAVALIDCLATDRTRLRNFPRHAWIVLILLCPVAGAIAWFHGGHATSAADAYLPAPSRPGRGVVGPDDDPEFLRMLGETLNQH